MMLRRFSVLSVLFGLFCNAFTSAQTAGECPLSMWVFDSLDRCDSIDPPNAIGTLYADGQCRSVQDVATSSPVYSLFPGYYSAKCTAEGKVLIDHSGCVSDTCAAGSFGVCEADTSIAGHLFSRFAAPEYEVQDPGDAGTAGFYTCFRLQGSGDNAPSVTFVIFGDCTTPECQQHAPPVVAPVPTPNNVVIQNPRPPSWADWPGEAAPIIAPPTAPFTWRPAPTPPPKPTPDPTQRPTGTPNEAPTTFAPTTAAPSTAAPSTAFPTLTQAPIPAVILTETEITTVGLRLSEMMGVMDNDDLDVWTNVTAAHVLASAKAVTDGLLHASIENVAQTQLDLVGLRQRRRLEVALALRFDVVVEYIAGTVLDVEALFAQAFDEEKERIQYVRELVRRDAAAFESLNQIWVLGADDNPVPPPVVGNETKSPVSGVLIGSITSVVLSLIAGACIMYYLFHRRKQHKAGKAERLPPDTPEESTMSHTNKTELAQKYTNEILVDTEADDVSTLGGSVLNNNHATATVGDEPTASVNLDYDFEKKQYIIEDANTAFSAVSKSLNMGLGAESSSSVFADDDVSFEQQYYADASNHVKRSFRPFEVQAPAGLLGMVVDTPSNSGIPVVRAIKPDSVLAGQIQIGDRLIAVDQEDVTKMSAMQVSNLISLKQNHPRVLVFVRVV